MIVFTVTNKVTQQVYVGTTRESVDDRWSQLVLAAGLPLEFPLYDEIRQYGAHSFDVQEWAEASSREELVALEEEAIESFNAKSLRGYRTSVVAPAAVRASREIPDPEDF